MRRVILFCLALLTTTRLAAQTPYRTPPQVIVDILDAPPLPTASTSPDRQWTPSSASLLCEFIPDGRGAAPVAPQTPAGPTIQETRGRAAPAATFEDLLKNAFDEQLFDYYFTSQLAMVNAATGARTSVGQPAIFDRVDVAPGGEHLLVVRTVRPFSYLVPSGAFPQELEVWNLRGELVRSIAKLPSSEGVPIRGVRVGPRAVNWRPGAPATLVWAEALDGGDPRTKVERQDRVVTLAAPFTAEPTELARLAKRYAGLTWDTQGVGFLQEYDRERRWSKTWIVEANKPGTAPVLLFDRSAEERYADPGFPIIRMTPTGDFAMQRSGDWIYFTGTGASPQRDRPFLDRLSLKTRKTERLCHADTGPHESVVALLDDAAKRFVTSRDSPT